MVSFPMNVKHFLEVLVVKMSKNAKEHCYFLSSNVSTASHINSFLSNLQRDILLISILNNNVACELL